MANLNSGASRKYGQRKKDDAGTSSKGGEVVVTPPVVNVDGFGATVAGTSGKTSRKHPQDEAEVIVDLDDKRLKLSRKMSRKEALIAAADVLRHVAEVGDGSSPSQEEFDVLRAENEKLKKDIVSEKERADGLTQDLKSARHQYKGLKTNGALSPEYPSIVVNRLLKTKSFEQFFAQVTSKAKDLGYSEGLRDLVHEHPELSDHGAPTAAILEADAAADEASLNEEFDKLVSDGGFVFDFLEHFKKMPLLPDIAALKALDVDYNTSLPEENRLSPIEKIKTGLKIDTPIKVQPDVVNPSNSSSTHFGDEVDFEVGGDDNVDVMMERDTAYVDKVKDFQHARLSLRSANEESSTFSGARSPIREEINCNFHDAIRVSLRDIDSVGSYAACLDLPAEEVSWFMRVGARLRGMLKICDTRERGWVELLHGVEKVKSNWRELCMKQRKLIDDHHSKFEEMRHSIGTMEASLADRDREICHLNKVASTLTNRVHQTEKLLYLCVDEGSQLRRDATGWQVRFDEQVARNTELVMRNSSLNKECKELDERVHLLEQQCSDLTDALPKGKKPIANCGRGKNASGSCPKDNGVRVAPREVQVEDTMAYRVKDLEEEMKELKKNYKYYKDRCAAYSSTVHLMSMQLGDERWEPLSDYKAYYEKYLRRMERHGSTNHPAYRHMLYRYEDIMKREKNAVEEQRKRPADRTEPDAMSEEGEFACPPLVCRTKNPDRNRG